MNEKPYTTDQLVERYRDASNAENASPNPRVRAAVLAHAQTIADAATRATPTAPFAGKRAANDSRWKYALAASVFTASITAFIAFQLTSDPTEDRAAMPAQQVATAPASPAAAPATTAGAAPAPSATPRVESSNEPAKTENEVTKAERAREQSAITLRSEIATTDLSKSARTARTETQTPTFEKKTAIASPPAPNRLKSEPAPRIAQAPTATPQAFPASPAAPPAPAAPPPPAAPMASAEQPGIARAKRATEPTIAMNDSGKREAMEIVVAPSVPSARERISGAGPSIAQAAKTREAEGDAMMALRDSTQRASGASAANVELATEAAKPATGVASAAAPAAGAAPLIVESRPRVGEMTPGMQASMRIVHANSALRGAVSSRNAQAAKRALASGADPNATDDTNTSLLIVATRNGLNDIALLLLDAGANAAQRDASGMTVLDYARRNDNRALVEALTKATSR